MFHKAFWIATAERAISNGAGAVLGVVGADELTSKLDVSGLGTYGLVAAGGALFSVLKALAAYNLTSSGSPSLTPKAEVDSALAPLTGGN